MKILELLRKHKFEGYLIAFVLMLAPPLPMYYAAGDANWPLFWFLLVFVIFGNMIALFL